MTATATSSESILASLSAAGSLTVGQISSVTGMKRIDVTSALLSLEKDGVADRLGGSVWRVKPGSQSRPADIARAALTEARRARSEQREGIKALVQASKPKQRKRKAPMRAAILKALRDAGGVADTRTIALTVGVKNKAISDAAGKLKADGKLISAGIGVYALPKAKLPAADSHGRSPAPAGSKPRGTVGRQLYSMIEARGGEATAKDLAEELRLPVKRVQDSLYHLRVRGWLETTGKGSYRIVGFVAPAPVDEVSPCGASEVAVEPQADHVPGETLASAPAAPEAADASVEDLVGDLLALACPEGVPATSKGTKAAAKFVVAAERLIAVARG